MAVHGILEAVSVGFYFALSGFRVSNRVLIIITDMTIRSIVDNRVTPHQTVGDTQNLFLLQGQIRMTVQLPDNFYVQGTKLT